MTSRTAKETVVNMFTATDRNNFNLDWAQVAGVWYDAILTNTSVTINGETYPITDTTEGSSNSRALALFANYAGGRRSYMDIALCGIYEDETPVFDYIPCVNADGRPCFHDVASGQDEYNAGSGEFEYAEIGEEV